ncbi:hypothetical protein M404DRAFT_198440 [Pisolithus tinctorius Marx 270]|uniref:Uncharacterized protein n=1 Tax=Pisolithus tinctorius Marx 270 TaxID=870435 RepID=A0A0C3PZW0_PISTI|nr:hypothetical protein M404DRAFT_198440 [Pisolithus tinctorius Marx 270]
MPSMYVYDGAFSQHRLIWNGTWAGQCWFYWISCVPGGVSSSGVPHPRSDVFLARAVHVFSSCSKAFPIWSLS